jgi:hypothetical protein
LLIVPLSYDTFEYSIVSPISLPELSFSDPIISLNAFATIPSKLVIERKITISNGQFAI